MTNKDKVMHDLEQCLDDSVVAVVPADTVRDALTLLKMQEPVKPKWQKGYAYCGYCWYKLHWIVERNSFCPNCGRAVKLR